MKQNKHCPEYSGPMKAVIFDWAGTIVDYGSCAPAVAFVEVFKTFDIDITIAEARAPMGLAKREHIASILRSPSVMERWRNTHGKPPTEGDLDRVYERFLPSQLKCLHDYSRLIPGTLETVAECRRRGMKIGSSTGYTKQLMDVVLSDAAEQGLEPDAMVCADDVPAGRPAPWMCFENARRMGVYPVQAIVKVDDTLVGIEAGRNAGMWTVGIAKSGNMIGLTEEQVNALQPADLQERLDAAYEKFFAAGAHFVIDTVADLPRVFDAIESSEHRMD